MRAHGTPMGFGLRLTDPFTTRACTGSHLLRLSAAPLWRLLFLVTAFYVFNYA